MTAKRHKKPPKKVKGLRAKPLSTKQAKGVRGGGSTATSNSGMGKTFYEWKR